MDWRIDASSRDFTINALNLGFDGVIYDYFNGRDDIDRRKLQFLRDPADSIKGDPATILRYFRFYGEICQEPNDHDPKVLNAISTLGAGLADASRKRMWHELKSILTSKFKHDLLKTILQLGLAPNLGLPSNSDIEEVDALFERAGHLYLRPITILTALLQNEAEMTTLKHWFHFSAFGQNLGNFILNNREGSLVDDPLQSYQILLEKSDDKWGTRMWIEQMLSYRGEVKLLTEFKTWAETNVPSSNERSRVYIVNYNIVREKLKRRLGNDVRGLSKQQLRDNIDELMKLKDNKR